jgi:hypothetical protein
MIHYSSGKTLKELSVRLALHAIFRMPLYTDNKPLAGQLSGLYHTIDSCSGAHVETRRKPCDCLMMA